MNRTPCGSSCRHMPWRRLSRKSSSRRNLRPHRARESFEYTPISSSLDWRAANTGLNYITSGPASNDANATSQWVVCKRTPSSLKGTEGTGWPTAVYLKRLSVRNRKIGFECMSWCGCGMSLNSVSIQRRLIMHCFVFFFFDNTRLNSDRFRNLNSFWHGLRKPDDGQSRAAMFNVALYTTADMCVGVNSNGD